jgi:cytochrome c oxidase subunit 4
MSARTHKSGPEPPSLRANLLLLGGLLALLALTVICAKLPLGSFNVVAGIGIACAKALLVAMFFMRLRTDSPLLRIVAAVGFAWLAVLIVLSAADVLTRVPNGPLKGL